MLEPYTIENTGNIFSKKCAMKWLHLLIQTFVFYMYSYNCLLSNKVWGEEDFFNGHEEYFRVLYAINELLG